jgi:hypothetical protein
MFSKNQHLEKSLANRTFAESLTLENHTRVGWALTALFYSALHSVDAYLSTRGKSDLKHQQRNRFISEDSELSGMYGEYKDLFVLSINARYLMHCYKSKHYEQAHRSLQIVQEWINNLLLGLPTH